MTSLSPMVQGYLDGYQSSYLQFPAHLKNKGASYKHGWLNGRDDRVGTPRDRAEVLRRRADMLSAAKQEAA